jgi:hypothetical protein
LAKFSFFIVRFSFYICRPARVAKLVDAPSSGGGVRKDVLVRIQSRAQALMKIGAFLFERYFVCIFYTEKFDRFYIGQTGNAEANLMVTM